MQHVRRFLSIVLFSALSILTAQAQTTIIHGTARPLSLQASDLGSVSDTMLLPQMQLYLAPTAAQRQALAQLLADQRTPQSAQYRRWLKPSEFGVQFGVSAENELRLRSWLAEQGFSNVRLSASRTVVSFSGTAEQATKAFHTSIHHVTTDGEQHYANVTDIAVPSTLAGLIQSVRGLDNFRPRSLAAHTLVRPQFTNANGYYGIAPGDIAAMYDIQGLYSSGIDGTGITAAVVGQTNIDLADIAAFRSGFNLPSNVPTVVTDPASTDPGTNTQDLIEADLDLELLGAVARNAKILYVNSANVYTSLQYAIDQNLAQVISMSYGSCESNTAAYYQSFELLAQQANAQGITIIAGSGDTGAAGCDSANNTKAQSGLAVESPASTPEVTGVGGTSFISPYSSYFGGTNDAQGGSIASYIPETAWNTTTALGYLSASGGGASAFYSKPTWQQGDGVPNDGKRDVPDVAMFSMTPSVAYLICTGGDCTSGAPNFITSGELIGGTSAGTPIFAGIVALLNHYLVTNHHISTPGLGNINPHLYLLAANTSDVFHDITTGGNGVPCVASSTDCTSGNFGFSAGPGYDQVTGLGSVDAFNLMLRWSNYSAVATSTTLTESATSPKVGDSITFTAKVKAAEGTTMPTGSVVFYDNNAALASVQIDASGTATYTSSTLSAGAHSIQASYGGSVDFAQSLSPTLSETVLQLTTTTLMPSATQITQGNSITLTATVSGPNQVPTGKVNYYAGTALLGSAQLSNGSATFSTSALPVGIDSLSASYSGDTTFAGSTSPAVSVTVNGSAPTVTQTSTTLTASPAQAIQGATVTLTASVAPTAGTTLPTGTVAFYSGTTALGTVSLSNGSATLNVTTLPIGTNSLTASYAGSSVFGPSTSSAVTVTVQQPSFTISAASSTLSVTGGQTATTTLTITPVAGFNQTLSYACSGLPSGSSCTFGTPSVQSNGTTTVSLSISTTALSAALSRPLSSSTPLLAILPFLGILSMRRRKAIAGALQLGIVALVFIGTGVIGCSGKTTTSTPTQPTSPTPVTSTITITATPQSGAAHTMQIALTVK